MVLCIYSLKKAIYLSLCVCVCVCISEMYIHLHTSNGYKYIHITYTNYLYTLLAQIHFLYVCICTYEIICSLSLSLSLFMCVYMYVMCIYKGKLEITSKYYHLAILSTLQRASLSFVILLSFKFYASFTGCVWKGVLGWRSYIKLVKLAVAP